MVLAPNKAQLIEFFKKSVQIFQEKKIKVRDIVK